MKFKFFYLLASIFLLNACVAEYETYYVFDSMPTENISQCVNYCQKTKDKCSQSCSKGISLCKKDHNLQAEPGDSSYLNNNEVTNLVFDPVQCVEMSCDCDRDYRACYQMCGGTIQTKKRCIANCPDT